MSPPRELGALRVAVVDRGELERQLGFVCEARALEPGTWRQRITELQPHLLLVGADERLDPEWSGNAIEDLLDICGLEGIPRVLWATGADLDPVFLELPGRFDRGFSVGIEQLMAMFQVGFPDPSLLWLATALPVDDGPVSGTASRPDSILCAGGWQRTWPTELRERLMGILRAAAPHGLRIAAPEPAPFPQDLHPYVDAISPDRRADALKRAKLVIAADDGVPAEGVMPAIAFDAIACGAAVISPVSIGSVWDFWTHEPPNRLIPELRDQDDAAAAIGRLLGDDALRERIVHECRKVVTYNHTYSHRAATLASVAGYALVPDDTTRSTHS